MLKITSDSALGLRVDCLIVPVCEDSQIHTDRSVASAVRQIVVAPAFSGKTGELWIHPAPKNAKFKHILLVGLGPRKELVAETFRAAAGRSVRRCIDAGWKSAAVATPGPRRAGLAGDVLARSLMEGACLGNHRFDAYKSEKKKHPLRSITVIVPAAAARARAADAKVVAAECRAAGLARDWVSLPANAKRPDRFAQLIAKEARAQKLHVSIMDKAALVRKKFGALLAVAVGSSAPPRLVTIEYRPKKATRTVVLVGKGVTFDTGGINIKPSSGLAEMKADMAGAAAIAATMTALKAMKPNCRVVALLPLVENMVSGAATRPGDIVRSKSGITVEIGNTDAEGRLILADAITHARETYAPDVILDMATLTGACVVALGEKMAGVFTEDTALGQSIQDAGDSVHERCWPMPMPADYKALLKSDFADMNNIGANRWGGAITAALFLAAFAEDSRWAHIDIAGPAYASKASAYCGPGGTGFGVRLLCRWIDQWAAK